MPQDPLPEASFATRAELRSWLEAHHDTSPGLWVRIARARSDRVSISFEELLEEGICFGWSESQRRGGDEHSYLQRFTPRARAGTTSARNRRLAAELEVAGRMTDAGRRALGGSTPS